MREPYNVRHLRGLIHYNSITINHIERKADGGIGVRDNGQIACPNCNTWRNWRV